MSPKLMTSKGGIAGKGMDERERADARGGVEPRQGGIAGSGVGGDIVGRELSASPPPGPTVSDGRREMLEAPECLAGVESCAPNGRADAGVGAGSDEVQRRDRGAVRPDARP
jgi:hypothetical protein